MNISFNDENGNIINYYEVLNVPFNAEKMDIRSSFCNLIKFYHSDISGVNSFEYRKKADILIKGYKILTDESLKKEYDSRLFSEQNFNSSGYAILSKKRIKYSMSLSDLLKTRLLNKKIRHKERIGKFGQDVEIFISPGEAKKGCIAYIDLPVRMSCPLCYGKDSDCHVCMGVGRINSSSTLEVSVSPPVEHGRIIDFDLIKARPDRFTMFTMKNLRVKISIIGKK